ncbi:MULTISPECIES: hypothetical protein [Rhizobium]|nr:MULTISPECIES: hypothetical protein [Rhizobium]MBM7049961.1 hypothetical protein [Rhizobium lusitanum]
MPNSIGVSNTVKQKRFRSTQDFASVAAIITVHIAYIRANPPDDDPRIVA